MVNRAFFIRSFFGAALIVIILAAIFALGKRSQTNQTVSVSQSSPQASSSAVLSTTATVTKTSALLPPLSDALSRITKKPFGIYITPQTSPVQPERFTGYHTGVDFETTPAEQNVDVPVSAVCDGPLVMKKWASGYGGVAVQKCTVQNQTVTIIYGHLNIDSVIPKVGDQLKARDQFAVLGKGYSQQTDGERKHLHLGIHKGTSINILGYVQNKAGLSNWLDVQKLLQ